MLRWNWGIQEPLNIQTSGKFQLVVNKLTASLHFGSVCEGDVDKNNFEQLVDTAVYTNYLQLDYELKISVWCNLDLLIVYEKEIFWF